MDGILRLGQIEPTHRPSVADQVFQILRAQIIGLKLVPGAKISEVEVAKLLGVSRQPVRDAFYRLSSLGLLTIRPQRATVVSLISPAAVMQARFIRAAIEAETVRIACQRLGAADHDALNEILVRQKHAVEAEDREGFHALDDAFHREICERAGCGFAWTIILENKSHIDRVRLLSLSFGAADALADHLKMLEAIRSGDCLAAMEETRRHLKRIKQQITRIIADNPAYFVQNETAPPDF